MKNLLLNEILHFALCNLHLSTQMPQSNLILLICQGIWGSVGVFHTLASKRARENNRVFYKILFRSRPIGLYISVPYPQPYGLPVLTMPFFDTFFE